MKSLLGFFAILLAVVVAISVYDSNKGEKTFKSDLAVIDTANVSTIKFYPKTEKKGIKLFRQNKIWKVSSNGKEFAADDKMIEGILKSIAFIKAERVATNDKSKYKDYEITDSLGTKVIVEVSSKKAAEFTIGKFSYKQLGQGYSMSSFVKLEGEPEVYSVEGQMSMYFNRDLNSFRNKTIIKAGAEDFTKLTFTYPGDSSFVLANVNKQWKVNGEDADSTKVKNYLNSIANFSGSSFGDEKTIIAGTPVFLLKVEGKNISNTEIKAFPADSINKFILTSSLNDGAKFISGNSRLAERLFEGKKKFLK